MRLTGARPVVLQKPYQDAGGTDTAFANLALCDVGRWLNAKSCRDYISSALADLGSEELETPLIREFAQY